MTIAKKHLDHFKEELPKLSNPAYADKMKAYMKGQFDYYGVRGPDTQKVFSQYWKWNKEELSQGFRPFISLCWKEDQRELQYVAIHLLKKIKKYLNADDLLWIENFILTKSWWDTVDFLASHAIGQILKSDADLKYQKSEEYINNDSLWIRRTALIFQLFYKDETDSELLFALIDSTLGSKEFFINKAAGWALRQYSKTNPTAVRDYIDLQRHKLANLTIKEGSKYL